MKLWVYMSSSGASAARLKEEISKINHIQPNIFYDIETLKYHIQHLQEHRGVLLFMAQSSRDISKIVPLKEMGRDISLILILPNWKKEIVARAHSLYPRFLTDEGSDFADVSAVLRKMFSSQRLPDWPFEHNALMVEGRGGFA